MKELIIQEQRYRRKVFERWVYGEFEDFIMITDKEYNLEVI